MIIISKKDFEGFSGCCSVCGSVVASYLNNSELINPKEIIELDGDWWMACTNNDCKNSYGEGYCQEEPDWVIFGKETKENKEDIDRIEKELLTENGRINYK